MFLSSNVSDLSNGLLAFHMASTILRWRFSQKQTANIVSGTHALVSLAFSGSGDLANLRWFSTAYFLYDIFTLVKGRKYGLVNVGYIYHHLAAIYLLRCNPDIIPTHSLMFWGELSNLASYPLYYYLHLGGEPQREKIAFLRSIQRHLYCGIRIPAFSWQLFWFLRTSPAWQHLVAIVPVYLMGVVWSIRILSQEVN